MLPLKVSLCETSEECVADGETECEGVDELDLEAESSGVIEVDEEPVGEVDDVSDADPVGLLDVVSVADRDRTSVEDRDKLCDAVKLTVDDLV